MKRWLTWKQGESRGASSCSSKLWRFAGTARIRGLAALASAMHATWDSRPLRGEGLQLERGADVEGVANDSVNSPGFNELIVR